MSKRHLKSTRKNEKSVKALRLNAFLLYTAYTVSVNKAGAKPIMPTVVFKPCVRRTSIFNTDRQTVKIIYMKVPLTQHFCMQGL